MAAFATAGAIIFLRARQPATAIYSSAAVIVLTILGAQLISAADAKPYAQGRADAGWIDQAVGAGSDVATIITARSTRNLSAASTRDLWMDEFFNRSVHDVLSIGGPLPDGLPVHRLTLDADGCLSGLTADRYAVALAEEPLDAPIVARDPHTRSILYRLSGKRDRACLAGAR